MHPSLTSLGRTFENILPFPSLHFLLLSHSLSFSPSFFSFMDKTSNEGKNKKGKKKGSFGLNDLFE